MWCALSAWRRTSSARTALRSPGTANRVSYMSGMVTLRADLSEGVFERGHARPPPTTPPTCVASGQAPRVAPLWANGRTLGGGGTTVSGCVADSPDAEPRPCHHRLQDWV